MAWDSSPKVKLAREIAKKYDQDQIIILMINEGLDRIEYISYGKTKRLCDEAKSFAEKTIDAITECYDEIKG